MTELINNRTTLADDAMRELTIAFADAMASGDDAAIESMLGDDVAYQVPGRSPSAGVHHGRGRVIEVLTTPARPGAVVDSADVTETLVDDHRAFCSLLLTGSVDGEPFGFEVAFHLASDGESITGITEYSGDQYTIDRLLGPPPPPADVPAVVPATPVADRRSARGPLRLLRLRR